MVESKFPNSPPVGKMSQSTRARKLDDWAPTSLAPNFPSGGEDESERPAKEAR